MCLSIHKHTQRSLSHVVACTTGLCIQATSLLANIIAACFVSDQVAPLSNHFQDEVKELQLFLAADVCEYFFFFSFFPRVEKLDDAFQQPRKANTLKLITFVTRARNASSPVYNPATISRSNLP
eukprot:m.186176 g.186176  ORF g.186176 m.186176 type:complete len:124 (+) comp14751_c0_seq1:1655-2026(+)